MKSVSEDVTCFPCYSCYSLISKMDDVICGTCMDVTFKDDDMQEAFTQQLALFDGNIQEDVLQTCYRIVLAIKQSSQEEIDTHLHLIGIIPEICYI